MNWTRHDTRALIEAAEDKPCISPGAVRVIRRHYAEPGLVERMARFEDFCDRTNALPLIWGQADCSLLIADWAIENGHADPAGHLRGAYDTEAGCRALLGARGGLLSVVGDCAARIGLHALHEPEFGAVAVIGSARNQDRQWAAIWNGRRWLVKWGDEASARWAPFAASPLGMWAV